MPPTTPSPELSRPLPLGRLTGQELVVDVRADAGELVPIAHRLHVIGLDRLEARFTLRLSSAGIVEADGLLRATVTQECVVSLDAFDSTIVEPFTVRFVPAACLTEELLDPDAIDEIPYDGESIDLGEAAVEQLALALDPFPRKPGVSLPPDQSAPEGGATTEPDTVRPFASLKSRFDA